MEIKSSKEFRKSSKTKGQFMTFHSKMICAWDSLIKLTVAKFQVMARKLRLKSQGIRLRAKGIRPRWKLEAQNMKE